MLKFAVFAGLFILLIATSGCLEGPAGPPGESSVDTVYVVDTGGVSGYKYDTVFVCPAGMDSTFYVNPGFTPSYWIGYEYVINQSQNRNEVRPMLQVYKPDQQGWELMCTTGALFDEQWFHIYYK